MPRISDYTVRQQAQALRDCGDQRNLPRAEANAAVLAALIARYGTQEA